MTTTAKKDKTNLPVKKEAEHLPTKEGTMSQRFTSAVIREFGKIGKLELTPFQQRLAQHLFIKIDQALNEAEKKRTVANNPPIIWANINMQRLSIDAIHRIELGLDALIDNHIYPIPYLNNRTKQYDLDLRVGHLGKDYYRRKMAIEEPEDIEYDLVYSSDDFKVITKPYADYLFDKPKPFDRGNVIGGFGYIKYKDKSKNKLILVTEEDFKKAESMAQSDKFWKVHPVEMRYKTLVHRTIKHVPIDPTKVNAAFLAVEASDEEADALRVQEEINLNANKGPVLDIESHAEAPESVETPAGPETASRAFTDTAPGCPDGGEASEEKCKPCKSNETCIASVVKGKREQKEPAPAANGKKLPF